MREFIGRSEELASLQASYDLVEGRIDGAKPGRLVMMRGRRRVGKSTLLEAFIERTGCPSLFFAASRQGEREPVEFAAELADSNLPGAGLAVGQEPRTWGAALSLLASALPDDEVSIVVIDEFPYLLEGDRSADAAFQKAWDRQLAAKPVLLVLVGSDLAMMEQLNDADRALHQRGTEMVIQALSPWETAQIVESPSAADAFDAYLVTGGLPLICAEWSRGQSMWDYLESALAEPTSALIVSAERTLRGEFPTDAQAGLILGQIGSGAVTHTNIARAGGGLTAAAVTRGLDILTTKRMVARDLPLSTQRSKDPRYRVTDPYLQFWLRFIGPHMPEIERRRSDRVLARIRRDWTTWRGRAVEPVIHEALARLLPIDGLPDAQAIGGYWTRSNDPEVDIVAADRAPIAKTIAFTGTIKWHESAPLDQAAMAKLAADTPKIPGADASTPLIAVSRRGADVKGAARVLGPEDLLAAWAR